jgi:hypothetical protein
VNTRDFPDKTTLKAIPYGIYDVAANEGLVEVGTSLNTARFRRRFDTSLVEDGRQEKIS